MSGYDLDFVQKTVERAVMAHEMCVLAERWATYGYLDEIEVARLEVLGSKSAISPLMLLRHYQDEKSRRDAVASASDVSPGVLPGLWTDESMASTGEDAEGEHSEPRDYPDDHSRCSDCGVYATPLAPQQGVQSAMTIIHLEDCKQYAEIRSRASSRTE